MKKTILFVLAGMMLFAFSQCGSTKSKSFRQAYRIISEYEKNIKNAKSCEELEEAYETFERKGEALDTPNFSVTDEELKELEKKAEELFELQDKRERTLCK